MGSRPSFTFPSPQEIYAEKYGEVVREIEGDLFTYRHPVVEAYQDEWHNPAARSMSCIAGNVDHPEKHLEAALSGLMGLEAQDVTRLAIAHVAHHRTMQHVRGYWPQWSGE